MIDLDTKKQNFEIGMDISSIPDNSENYSRTLMAVPPDTPVENHNQDGCQDFPKTIPSIAEPYLGLSNETIDVDLLEPKIEDSPQSTNPIKEARWVTSDTPGKNRAQAFSSWSYGDNANFKCHIESETNYVGLVNQAMTCYLNSLLQALYMTPEFRNALYNWEYQGSEKDEALSIPYELQKLFLNLQTSRKSAVETTSLTRSFGWDSNEAWQQHDIQELCRVMFDALEQKFENTKQADLIKLYEGKMIDYVKCLECKTEKSREDTFLDIPLPVRPYGNTQAYNSVEEAMNAFVQYEKLEGSNQYHCEKCNKKCDANKGLKFTKFPYILTLHLKRFDFDHKFGHRIKLNDKVTFPDELNLNSFVSSSSNLESPVSEEDISINAKCEDGLTTNSGTLDDDGSSPPCENGFPNNHDGTNHDQDDDEGIDISTSNCNNRNHENEKQCSNIESGPYIYELFSIMIHSGSANGGHYYANIKDFGTGKWYCFNDQSVSQITHDDIQKTYGGGPLRRMYSGAYGSSTNAYMLMYRQIDPTRNALPMQEQDLPQHIQELLKRMKENEAMKHRSFSVDSTGVYLNLDDEFDRANRTKPKKLQLTILHFPPPPEKLLRKHLHVYPGTTMVELTKMVRDKFNFVPAVHSNQCRLLLYNPNNQKVRPLEDKEEKAIVDLIDYPDENEFLLEVLNDAGSETPSTIKNSVFVVDFTSKEVCEPKIQVTSSLSQTVLELKQALSTLTHIDLNEIKVITQHTHDRHFKILKCDDHTLEREDFSEWLDLFVYREIQSEDAKHLSELTDIIERFRNNISLTIVLSDVIEENVEDVDSALTGGIHRAKRRVKKATCFCSTERRIGPIKPKCKMSLSLDNEFMKRQNSSIADVTPKNETGQIRNDVLAKNSISQSAEGEEWNTPEQSNSEDSSLSDSDKTLIGDAPDEDDTEFVSQDIHSSNLEQMEFPDKFLNDSNTDEWEDKFDSNYYFEATVTGGKEKLLQVNVDKTMSLGTFKKKLEPYVGVSKEHFSFYHPKTNVIHSDDKPLRFNNGTRLELKIEKVLQIGEWKVQVDRLTIDSMEEPIESLFKIIVSDDMTIQQVKEKILSLMERKGQIIPYEKLRLMELRRDTLRVLFDDETCRELMYPNPPHFIVQELLDKEIVTDREQSLLFVRKYVSMVPNKYQETVVNKKSLEGLRDEISSLSGIPKEHLSICPLFFRDLPIRSYIIDRDNDLWIDYSAKGLDYQTRINITSIFLYRNNRERLSNTIELNRTVQENIVPRMKSFKSDRGYGRQEKGLKIKVNDK